MSALILVLDDDAVIRNLLCEVLQDEGFQVVAAETLQELLTIAPKHADALITDFLLHFEEVGLKAIESVRGITQPQLPAIICTAALKQSEDRHAEIARLGAHLLLKPFTIDELLDTLDRALKPAIPDVPQTSLKLRAVYA
jgi:two-component system nitrogen regulation response regulator NtrX